MFKTTWTMGLADFDTIRYVRELSLPSCAELTKDDLFDGNDAMAAHLLVMTGDSQPIATARMLPADDALIIGHTSLIPRYLNMGYEELVMRLMLYKAKQLPQKTVIAYILPGEAPLYVAMGFEFQKEALPFYIYSMERIDIDLSGHCKTRPNGDLSRIVG